MRRRWQCQQPKKKYLQLIPESVTPTQPGTPNPDLMSEKASKLKSEVCVGVGEVCVAGKRNSLCKCLDVKKNTQLITNEIKVLYGQCSK